MSTLNSYRIHLIQLAHNPTMSQKITFYSIGFKVFLTTLWKYEQILLFSQRELPLVIFRNK